MCAQSVSDSAMRRSPCFKKAGGEPLRRLPKQVGGGGVELARGKPRAPQCSAPPPPALVRKPTQRLPTSPFGRQSERPEERCSDIDVHSPQKRRLKHAAPWGSSASMKGGTPYRYMPPHHSISLTLLHSFCGFHTAHRSPSHRLTPAPRARSQSAVSPRHLQTA
jgi:hypothetical protein